GQGRHANRQWTGGFDSRVDGRQRPRARRGRWYLRQERPVGAGRRRDADNQDRCFDGRRNQGGLTMDEISLEMGEWVLEQAQRAGASAAEVMMLSAESLSAA